MPTLRERISAWAGRGATAPREFYPPQYSHFGMGTGNQPGHATLLQESLGIADMATRAIANRLATLNLQVLTSMRVADGTLEDEIRDDHVLQSLVRRPHPNFTSSQLMRLTGQWIVTVGEAYWLKVNSRGLQVPVELHPIPPTNISPVWKQGVIDHYVMTTGRGVQEQLPADTVIRFFFPDPENMWSSEGYLGPGGVTADSLKFSGQHLRSHYQDDAAPKTWMKSSEKAAAFSPAEKKAFALDFRNKYHSRLGTERGIPGMLPLGWELMELAFQTGADIVPLLEHWTDEQLMGMGVPKSLLGKVVSGDRSSAETNQWVFDRYTVLPIATLIEESLTLQLAPDFDDALFLKFESFVSEDKQFKLLQEQSDLDRKVKSINGTLKARAEDPVDWGEEPVGKIGETPYRPDEDFVLEDDDPGALGDPEDEVERTRLTRAQLEELYMVPIGGSSRAAAFAPDAEWQRQVAREKKFTPKFRAAVRAIIAAQRAAVLKELKQLLPRARISAPELFDQAAWVKAFTARVEPVRELAFKETMQETLGLLGTPDAFVFTDAMRETLRRQGALLIRQVNATTGERLAQAISKAQAEVIAGEIEGGISSGEGVELITKRVREVFNVRLNEARTIARTEVLKAGQTAQLEGFELSGVVEGKRWNDSQDGEVRHSHQASLIADVPIGQPFTLADGEQADAPGIGAGGGQLSAGNAINCRCFVTPIVEL